MNQILSNIHFSFVLIFMIACHIIYTYKGKKSILLLKQKSWWKENHSSFYINSYKVVLMEQAFLWSFIIHLPIVWHIFYYDGYYNTIPFLLSVFINCIIYTIVDDLKINKKLINFVQEQSIHFIQIIITWVVYSCGV